MRVRPQAARRAHRADGAAHARPNHHAPSRPCLACRLRQRVRVVVVVPFVVRLVQPVADADAHAVALAHGDAHTVADEHAVRVAHSGNHDDADGDAAADGHELAELEPERHAVCHEQP